MIFSIWTGSKLSKMSIDAYFAYFGQASDFSKMTKLPIERKWYLIKRENSEKVSKDIVVNSSWFYPLWIRNKIVLIPIILISRIENSSMKLWIEFQWIRFYKIKIQPYSIHFRELNYFWHNVMQKVMLFEFEKQICFYSVFLNKKMF